MDIHKALGEVMTPYDLKTQKRERNLHAPRSKKTKRKAQPVMYNIDRRRATRIKRAQMMYKAMRGGK